MRNCILIFCAILLTQIQAQDFNWVSSMGGLNSDDLTSLISDSAGNVYSTGYFRGSSDQDPSAAQFILNSNGLDDVFISKLDSLGSLVWVKHIGGSGFDVAQKITLDQDGNVYVVGYFTNTVDFDPSPITQFIMSATGLGDRDLFMVKLNSNGDFLSAMQVGGYDFVEGHAITIDSEYNIILAGRFLNNIDFDTGPGTFIMDAQGGYDAFILKIDSSQNFIWARQFGGSQTTVVNALKIDENDNIYSCGFFKGSGDFDSDTASVQTLTSGGTGGDMFLHKLDKNGNFVWVIQNGGNSGRDNVFSEIYTTKSGYIYGIGHFGGTVDFDPSPLNTLNLLAAGSSGQTDAVVLKYDTSGALVWAKQIEGPNMDQGGGITADPLDNVYITGYFQGIADFDPNPSTTSIETASGFPEIFVAKWSASGDYIWSQSIGDTGGDTGRSIDYCSNENIYVGGVFTGTVDFNSDPLINSNTSSTPGSSSTEIFVYAIGQNLPCLPVIEQTINLEGCDSLWFENQWYINSTSIIDTFISALACDSIVQYNITINESALTVIDIAACNEIQILNQSYFSDTVIYDTIQVSNLCDSIVQYNITINESALTVIDIAACNEIQILNQSYFSDTVIYDTIQISNLCDSIVQYNITINEPVLTTLNLVACDEIEVLNQIYYSDTVIYDTLQTINLCDSIVRYEIELNPSYSLNLQDTIEQGESYLLPSGISVDETGIYIAMFLSISNCDSMIVISLFVNENVGLKDLLNVSLTYFPNPIDDKINIQLKTLEEGMGLTMINAYGQNIKQLSVLKEVNEIDCSGLSSGVYILLFTNKEGEVISAKRVVKQ
jgi:hypothetical protein